MSSIDVPLKDGGFGSTRRTDNWWVEPILVFLGYMAFIVYATWAALQGNNYLCTTRAAALIICRRCTRRCSTRGACVVAGDSAVLGGDADLAVSGFVPLHLLLLPRRLLQSVLGGSGRTAQWASRARLIAARRSFR